MAVVLVSLLTSIYGFCEKRQHMWHVFGLVSKQIYNMLRKQCGYLLPHIRLVYNNRSITPYIRDASIEFANNVSLLRQCVHLRSLTVAADLLALLQPFHFQQLQQLRVFHCIADSDSLPLVDFISRHPAITSLEGTSRRNINDVLACCKHLQVLKVQWWATDEKMITTHTLSNLESV